MSSVAYAMAEGGMSGITGGMEGMKSFIPLILMFVIFYFLLIRPQQKRQKEHKALLSNLKRGDDIVTAGGIMGRITNVMENAVTMDFNHPLAGKDLRFAGKVIEVLE